MGRTLALLEPLLRKLEDLPAESLAAFKLPYNLGSPTPSIHQRIIKKVYGREAGMEVILALQEAPAFALPVVVNRLRQKDQEWRRGQTEFSKMWRDVDTRNFYKSLDHQGITFKANDKKAITTKALVAQLEQRKGNIFEESADLSEGVAHLLFSFEQTDVIQDAIKLCFGVLERQPFIYNKAERRSIGRLLVSLIPRILSKDFECSIQVSENTFLKGIWDDENDTVVMKDAAVGESKENLTGMLHDIANMENH